MKTQETLRTTVRPCRFVLRTLVLACSALLFFAAAGCSDDYDDTELRNGLNDLNDRVGRLEQQVAKLNDDYASMTKIVEKLEQNVYVASVESVEGGYKIVFSDGTSAVILNGKDGANGANGADGANGKDAPVIGIGQEDGVYYWTQTAGGKTEWLFDAEGNRMPVSGTTPVLGVDAEGYWTVSYDGGKSFRRILDGEGNPVAALQDSAFIKGVNADDTYVYITLNDGKDTQIILPLVGSFSLTIAGAEAPVTFAFGETKQFEVQSSGVEKVVITKPDEWKVACTDNLLTVTAPAAEHAACADLEGEISLIYFNAAGLSRAASLKVGIEESVACVEIALPTDFSGGNVQRALYNGQKVAEICLEYIRTDDVDRQMTVIYPADGTGKADLTRGIDVETGGTVVWNLTANTCTYTPGSDALAATKYYLDMESGALSTVPGQGKTAEAVVEPDLLRDVRGTSIEEYRITKIGTQYWMSESLRAEHFTDGTAIPADWDNEAGSYIYYNESRADWRSTYGALYSGTTLIANAERLAPEGWMIPTADEITVLKNYIGSTPGTKLKSTSGWSQYPGSNLTGFDALPGQYYQPSTAAEQFGSATPDVLFWTTTAVYDPLAKSNSLVYYRLYDKNTRLTFDPNPSSFAVTIHLPRFGHYVRCLRK